jgi:TonB family protein
MTGTPRARATHAALAVAALLALPPLPATAQQAPDSAPVGAALQLSDVGCPLPDPRMLQEFALAVQQHVAGQAQPGEFPQDALRERLQGTVYLRLTYAANLEQPSAGIERSSGHAVLDDYAVMLARRASPQPPDSLRCRSFDISFPLRFRISQVPAASAE